MSSFKPLYCFLSAYYCIGQLYKLRCEISHWPDSASHSREQLKAQDVTNLT